jgi:hypothetical protein
MQQVTLNSIPNQKLSVDALGVGYGIELRIIEDIMYATVYADSVILCYSVRCVPNQPMIPYAYLTKGGNFVWSCQDNDYPDWQKFNGLHSLLFLTDAELLENGF